MYQTQDWTLDISRKCTKVYYNHFNTEQLTRQRGEIRRTSKNSTRKVVPILSVVTFFAKNGNEHNEWEHIVKTVGYTLVHLYIRTSFFVLNIQPLGAPAISILIIFTKKFCTCICMKTRRPSVYFLFFMKFFVAYFVRNTRRPSVYFLFLVSKFLRYQVLVRIYFSTRHS